MTALSIRHISTLFTSSISQLSHLFSQPVFSLRSHPIQFSPNHHPYGFYRANRHRYCANSSSSGVNSADWEDSPSEEENHRERKSATTNEILQKLKRYGIAGVLSYGLLNTAYYLSTFLFVWLWIAPSPGKMGYLGAAQRVLKVLAMVWAGSQVTKLLRAAGALALAPFVDRGLSWFTLKFNFESQGKAFMAITGFCFGLAFLVFVVLTLLWS